ncbi:MAG: hypothetical protein WEB88_07555 [Gemmatimonadota bacterium]
MTPLETLRYVVDVLDSERIEYMITGSVASSLQGEPRATHDLDVVVAVQAKDAPALLRGFSRPRFYLDEQAILEAVRTGGMFNAISLEDGDKVDFWMLTSDPFDASRFARRVHVEVFGLLLKVSSPEDTILAKLRWSNMSGGSEKSFIDALRVFEVQARTLDRVYLEEWSERLGVLELWTRLQSEAELP